MANDGDEFVIHPRVLEKLKAEGTVLGVSGGEALSAGGGGGTYGGMDARVTRLETHFEYVRRDLDEIKGSQAQLRSDLRHVADTLRNLPTKDDLWAWKLQWVAIAVAAIALIVGGIIGGLAWIRPDPQPIVVTAPPAPPATQ